MCKLQASGLPGWNSEWAPHTEGQKRPRQAAVTLNWSVVFFTSKKAYKGGLSWWPPNEETSVPARLSSRSLHVSPPEGLYHTVPKAASLKWLPVKEQCVPRTGGGEETPFPGASSRVTQRSRLHDLDAEAKKLPPCRAELATGSDKGAGTEDCTPFRLPHFIVLPFDSFYAWRFLFSF